MSNALLSQLGVLSFLFTILVIPALKKKSKQHKAKE